MGQRPHLTASLLTALPIVRGSTKLIRDDSSCRVVIMPGKSPRRRFLTLQTECGEIAASFPLGVTGRQNVGYNARGHDPGTGLTPRWLPPVPCFNIASPDGRAGGQLLGLSHADLHEIRTRQPEPAPVEAGGWGFACRAHAGGTGSR
jgi:hypothetical protein